MACTSRHIFSSNAAEVSQEAHTLLRRWVEEWNQKEKRFSRRIERRVKLGTFSHHHGYHDEIYYRLSYPRATPGEIQADDTQTVIPERFLGLADFLKPYINEPNEPNLLYSPL